ncbi:hypothetical protein niasHS_013646 [Heterodera schachtii]|uniref:Protein kinase domain-containing protein n=1 Tax=Heterodera schachtii TaxID=97005 RepID=A0ABD2IGE3_HETSC
MGNNNIANIKTHKAFEENDFAYAFDSENNNPNEVTNFENGNSIINNNIKRNQPNKPHKLSENGAKITQQHLQPMNINNNHEILGPRKRLNENSSPLQPTHGTATENVLQHQQQLLQPLTVPLATSRKPLMDNSAILQQAQTQHHLQPIKKSLTEEHLARSPAHGPAEDATKLEHLRYKKRPLTEDNLANSPMHGAAEHRVKAQILQSNTKKPAMERLAKQHTHGQIGQSEHLPQKKRPLTDYLAKHSTNEHGLQLQHVQPRKLMKTSTTKPISENNLNKKWNSSTHVNYSNNKTIRTNQLNHGRNVHHGNEEKKHFKSVVRRNSLNGNLGSEKLMQNEKNKHSLMTNPLNKQQQPMRKTVGQRKQQMTANAGSNNRLNQLTIAKNKQQQMKPMNSEQQQLANVMPNKVQQQQKKHLDAHKNGQQNAKHLQPTAAGKNQHVNGIRAKTDNNGNKPMPKLTEDKKRRFKTVHHVKFDEAKLQHVGKTKHSDMLNNAENAKKYRHTMPTAKNGDTVTVHQAQPITVYEEQPLSLLDNNSTVNEDVLDGAHGDLENQTMDSRNPFKVLQLHKNERFLDFEEIPNDWNDHLKRHPHNCRHYEPREMKLVKIENEHGRVNTFYVFPEPISGGATSKVFHASPIDAVDMDGKPLIKCVAIKSVILEFDNATPEIIQGFEKEEHFLMMFRNNAKIKHIVHLHYMKKDYAKNRLIIILELGRHDLTKRIKLMRDQWKMYWGSTAVSIDRQIIKVLRQVLAAVNEMHGKTIHLDFKADNLLFVEEFNASGRKTGEVLKVIDFGGSEIIDPLAEKSNEASAVANVCRVRTSMWSDDRYSSPEQNATCAGQGTDTIEYTVSTKSDIWSIGIMLVEFLLMTPHFPEIDPIAKRGSDDANNIYNIVIGINHFHYSPADKTNAANKQANDYMHKIQKLFPLLSTIIKACLVFNPKQRPTAKGILQFLDGKCQFGEFENEKADHYQFDGQQHGQELSRRKKRFSSMLDGQKFSLFSHEILEPPAEIKFCDIGNLSEANN